MLWGITVPLKNIRITHWICTTWQCSKTPQHMTHTKESSAEPRVSKSPPTWLRYDWPVRDSTGYSLECFLALLSFHDNLCSALSCSVIRVKEKVWVLFGRVFEQRETTEDSNPLLRISLFCFFFFFPEILRSLHQPFNLLVLTGWKCNVIIPAESPWYFLEPSCNRKYGWSLLWISNCSG